MIAVDDRIVYREIVNGQPLAPVTCFVTRVHGPDLIDIGWKGDGDVHPDNHGRTGLQIHRRKRVARLGTIAVGDYVSPELQKREHTVWESAS